MTLDLKTKDVVQIGGDLYVKTHFALRDVMKELRAIGYEIEDLRKDDHRKERGTSVEQMEKNGWSLWYVRLPHEIRKGKCGSCKRYISTRGIQSHGHKCERCGAETYLDVIDGSTMRFVFLGEERGFMSPQLSMKVKRWDDREGWLYLYWEFLEGGLSTVTGDRADHYLNSHKSQWQVVEEDGQRFLKVKYSNPWRRDDFSIEPYDIYGHKWNHEIVKVWRGKEYKEHDRLPTPESFSVFETWHWAPLDASPTLHRKVLGAIHNSDDKGWHHQDGSPWFTGESFRQMGIFIREFTTLDADRWDAESRRFRRDGPGGIDDVARFCHPNAEVQDVPNMWNSVSAIAKGLSGRRLTEEEIRAAKKGAGDPAFKRLFGKP